MLGNRKQRLPVDLALFIGREMANGLAYAHRRTGNDGASLNLVHCDISPPNILVSFEGETKVIDFGIAKSAIRGTATDPKMGFGKFGYMAPEQLIRGGVVDHRTDIYAAGVVLYELLTGQRLYEAGPEPDYRALAKKVAKGEHKLPSEIDTALAPYDDLVATALRPKAEDRYQTAAEFRDAIQQALVSVNPTISTDQLGAYMRELFAEEMTAQRELHDRVAKAHLDDFQEQLDDASTTSTVSVRDVAAAAARRAAGRARRRRRRRTARAHASADRADRHPAAAAAAAAAAADRRDPDDRARPRRRHRHDRSRRRRRSGARRSRSRSLGRAPRSFVGGGLVFAFTRGDDARERADGRRGAAAHRGVDDHGRDDPARRAVAADAGRRRDAGEDRHAADQGRRRATPIARSRRHAAPRRRRTSRRRTTRVRHARPEARAGARREGIAGPTRRRPSSTREAVIAKFRAVSRQYDAYKQQNGGRLDQDWNDLASFIQYHPNDLDEFSRRIDAFRVAAHREVARDRFFFRVGNPRETKRGLTIRA